MKLICEEIRKIRINMAKVSRRKGTIKICEEMNKTEAKIKETVSERAVFLQKKKQSDKPLAMLM